MLEWILLSLLLAFQEPQYDQLSRTYREPEFVELAVPVEDRQIISPPGPRPGGTIHVLANCEQATVEAAVSAATAGDTIKCPADDVTWTAVSVAKKLKFVGEHIVKDIVSASAANPTVITTKDAHGFATDDVVSIVGLPTGPADASKCGADGLTAPCVWGEYTITVTGTHTFTIPVSVTTPRVGGQVIRHDTIVRKASDGLLLSLNAGSNGSRVTGFKFIRGGVNAGAIVDWRVDHNTFDATTSAGGWDEGMTVNSQSTTVFPQGVIDHNNFINARVLGQIYNQPVTPPPAIGSSGWSIPLPLGTGNMIFVEDNVFRNSLANSSVNSIDSSFAARFVVRNNIFSGVEGCHFHGVQGDLRGVRMVECYRNLFIKEDANDSIPGWQRAGTGVWFENVVAGTWGSVAFLLDNQRSFEDRPVSDRCNGTNPTWDGTGLAGYPCRDQPGTGVDERNATGEPYPAQASDPIYEWDNVTHTGGNVNLALTNTNSGTVTNVTSSTAFRLSSCASMTAAQGLIVAVDGGAEEATVISSIDGSCNVVVSPSLSSAPTVGDSFLGRSGMHIRSERDFFNDTPKPGYSPFTYPHPATLVR